MTIFTLRFEVFTAVKKWTVVLMDVSPCSLVGDYVKLDAICNSKTQVTTSNSGDYNPQPIPFPRKRT
jgi:hypothetical protein